MASQPFPQASSSGLSLFRAAAHNHLRAVAFSLAETLWPTRCCICDVEGAVLCERCQSALPFIDQWLACPRCGAPWGRYQCTECNRLSLREAGIAAFPFESAVAAVLFGPEVGRIVRTHKDANERRLADVMAAYIACAIPPEWVRNAVVTYIPATRAARVRRGFDHGQALGEAVAQYLALPCMPLLPTPHARDQRQLNRMQRYANMRSAFQVKPGQEATMPQRIIVVDDVMTTGATACAAAESLLIAGAHKVYFAAFARVY